MQNPSVENSVGGLVGTLRSDEGFRRHFLAAPAEALQQRGYDPDTIELPESADMMALEARLRLLTPAGSDGDIWEGLKELLADPGADPQFPQVILGPDEPPSTVAIAIAIYGVAIAVGPGDPGDDQQQLRGNNTAADLKVLRALARSEPDALTFSVHGADGLTASALTRDVLDSFLARLN
ncbi:hypothetical protein [Brevundimonas sp.]|uniref:hypothetical protein n=1 Tax=Brevundimonas sp. TaxID=1871086 RepID=UPI0025B9B725|nr:hypothetical protein [Brevundimonas sp.]